MRIRYAALGFATSFALIVFVLNSLPANVVLDDDAKIVSSAPAAGRTVALVAVLLGPSALLLSRRRALGCAVLAPAVAPHVRHNYSPIARAPPVCAVRAYY